jgi:hypothetical protein
MGNFFVNSKVKKKNFLQELTKFNDPRIFLMEPVVLVKGLTGKGGLEWWGVILSGTKKGDRGSIVFYPGTTPPFIRDPPPWPLSHSLLFGLIRPPSSTLTHFTKSLRVQIKVPTSANNSMTNIRSLQIRLAHDFQSISCTI